MIKQNFQRYLSETSELNELFNIGLGTVIMKGRIKDKIQRYLDSLDEVDEKKFLTDIFSFLKSLMIIPVDKSGKALSPSDKVFKDISGRVNWVIRLGDIKTKKGSSYEIFKGVKIKLKAKESPNFGKYEIKMALVL